MICMGHYEIKLPIHEKIIEKNKYVHINGQLENVLMYLYSVFECNVINASIT